MRNFSYKEVELVSGYLKNKQELNETVTINAVYDRFEETGRIKAFNCDWKEGDEQKPHHFWDSDVAKWMEGAAYILARRRDDELERRVESLIDCIEANQGEDGYFNIYYTVCAGERFTNRNDHELYCAGHLFEAAVAYAQATGRERFLKLMEKYAHYIYKVFVLEKSAGFVTPGHEEIELALVRLYRYTRNKEYLELASFFIEQRGRHEKEIMAFGSRELADYNQSHLPVREQREAVGHAVRAVYLYCAMADLAFELEDEGLKEACLALFEDIAGRKMYVTGGLGSCYLGECFSKPFNLPNSQAYNETCAGIGLMFFCLRMQKLDNRSAYADVIERVLYNGVLSALSLDGRSFFYENPLEITCLEHFSSIFGPLRFPALSRAQSFECSCCPPNINRLLPVLSEYVYAQDGDAIYINQFVSSILKADGICLRQETSYPIDGKISVQASGAAVLKIRIPSWCEKFTLNRPYTLKNGYAEIINDGGRIELELDMTPFAVRADARVQADVNKLCIQAGPVVYCAEWADNGDNLHALCLSSDFKCKIEYDPSIGLNALEISGFEACSQGGLYTRGRRELKEKKIRLIPYNAFANRGPGDMLVWFNDVTR